MAAGRSPFSQSVWDLQGFRSRETITMTEKKNMTPVRLVLAVILANLSAQWLMSFFWSLPTPGKGQIFGSMEWHAFGWFHWSGRLVLHGVILWFHWEWVAAVFVRSAAEARELRKVA